MKDDNKKIIGRMVNITVEKDKTGPGAGRVGEVMFMNGVGIDYIEELITLGESERLIARSGNTYSYRNISVTGRDRFKRKLADSPKARKRLRKAIMNGSAEVDGEEAEAEV